MIGSRTARHHRLFWIIALMSVLMLLIAPASASADPGNGNGKAHHTLRKGALPEHGPPSKPLQPIKNIPDLTKITAGAATAVTRLVPTTIDINPILAPTTAMAPAATTAATTPASIDVKTLVIAADGSEADLPAIQQALDYLGEPYTVYIAARTPGGLTADKLTDPNNSIHAYYQAVILTTGDLGICTSTCASALTDAEWTTLTNFEVAFGVRQVTWYTYPNANYGFNAPSGANGDPHSASFTAAGKTVFGSYANTATPVSIQYAYTYTATPLDGDTQPLLSDSAGNALGAIRSYKDSAGAVVRQNLALTFDSNQYLTHDLVLAYGLVNWATKGLFLGDRHASLLAQPDDIFIDDDIWWTPQGTAPACGSNPDNTGVTYRMTGADLTAFATWQKAKQAQATTGPLTIEFPFNGVGTTAAWIAENGTPPGQYSPDTLTPVVRTSQANFNWVSHTYDHQNLDNISAAAAKTELTQNDQVATQLRLNYTKQAMVTPDVSGLDNPNFLQAAKNFGVRYVVSDTSITTPTDPVTGQPRHVGTNPSPNAGRYNSSQPTILEIPRHPVNLYYNVTTPQQWLAEDNCLYPAGANGHVDTYDQLKDRESNVLLGYLLKGDIDPLMFHQPNLRAYDGTHSLLGDLLDATFTKYNALFKLPIKTYTEQAIGQRMANRMAYNVSGVTAKIVPTTPTAVGSITVTATNAATVPVTGVAGTCATCTVETYGGQKITSVKLAAGQSVTLSLA